MNITIANGCIVCGPCGSICPQVFTVFEDAEVRPEGIPGKERACREAAKAYPMDVILIKE